MKTYTRIFLLVASLAFLAGSAAEVFWMDGGISSAPKGKLLSDNHGFYGDVILTGADYHYRNKPEAGSGDSAEDTARQRGRRLQNGDIGNSSAIFQDLNPPRIASPAVVAFDLKSRCVITEVTIHLVPGGYRVKISTPEGDMVERDCKVTNPRSVERFLFDVPLSAQRLSIEVASDDGSAVALSEVWIWGDAPERDRGNRDLPGVAVRNTAGNQSVPGIAGTAVDENEFDRWQQTLRKVFPSLPAAVWSEFPAWGPLSKHVVLPGAEAIAAPVRVTMVRKEREAVLLVLTNTAPTAEFDGTITFSGFTGSDGAPASGLTAVPMALAALPSRNYGVQLTALISEDNKPGAEVLERYATNGAVLADFPRIALNPAGNMFCWLSITATTDLAPGIYTGTLSAGEGITKTIEVEVLDISLNDSIPRFVTYWWKPFGQHPFQSLDWTERDADARLAIGINVLSEHAFAGPELLSVWTERDPEQRLAVGDHVLGDPQSLGAKMREKNPDMILGFWLGEYGGLLWSVGHQGNPWGKEGIPVEDAEKIRAQIHALAQFARSRGLNDRQWYVEMSDEPNAANYRAFGEVAKVMHEAEPQVMISCNPCSWTPNGFEPDDVIYGLLKEWYDETVAISMPAHSLINYPQSGQLFRARRPYNGFYEVVTQRAKSEDYENVNYPRMLIWDAMAHGFNSWNMFSYFDSCMGEEVWDDLNTSTDTFTLVYPGPNGPVPTREYEAAREGFEEFLLMDLLRQRDPKVHAAVMRAFQEGVKYPELRRMIYQALQTATEKKDVK